jgi:hypothetical protein
LTKKNKEEEAKAKKKLIVADENGEEIENNDEEDFDPELVSDKQRRTHLIQIKVMPGLKKKALKRAKSLDMDLSEYIRFLLARDIHGL